MDKSWLEKIEIFFKIISSIAIPIILIIFNNTYKEKELRERYVAIAVGILNSKPTTETLPLRVWATNTINMYADIKLSPEAKEVLKRRVLTKPLTIDEVRNFDAIKDFDSVK